MIPAEAKDKAAAFWHAGDLSFLCRPNAQLDLYQFVTETSYVDKAIESSDDISPFVLECHRRLGKSCVIILLLLARCFRWPGQMCVFGAPTYEQVASIVVPNLEILLRSCPNEIRPRSSGYTYTIRNPAWGPNASPSTLRLVGVDYKQGDRLRGAFADAVGLDEVRDMANVRYLVESILGFQFVGRRYPWLAMASTAPASNDHDFTAHFVPNAIAEGRHRCYTVENNLDWKQRDTEMLLKLIGGSVGSIAWRREALNEHIGDEDELIVPEFQTREKDIVRADVERPAFFFPSTCMDTGWHDWNAVLYGHVDFAAQRLYIEDETVLRYKSSGTIAAAIKAKEEELWGTSSGGWRGGHRPVRFGDMKEQALEDMRTDHSVLVEPVQKWDRNEAIANLRTGIDEGRLVIHPRCKHLIYQAKNAIWDEARKNFARSKRMGHADALAALIYFYRHANWRGNPTPIKTPVYGMAADGFMIPVPGDQKRRQDLYEAFMGKRKR